MASKVVWGERGWFPTYYGFCPDARAWAREMKRLKIDVDMPYPTSDARATEFLSSDGKQVFLVTVGDHLDRTFRNDPFGLVCLLTHEAVHVWQGVRRSIGEKEPSAEFEAYAIHGITQNLCAGYQKTRVARKRRAAARPKSKRRAQRGKND